MTTTQFELQIQRLVDGEMGQSDRAEFLRRLDSDSHLWRSLALAYVEDQCFRRQYRAGGPGVADKSTKPARRAAALRFPWRGLAMAAAVLLALGLGFVAGDRLTRSVPAPENSALLTESQPASAASSQGADAVQAPAEAVQLAGGAPRDRWMPEIPSSVQEQFLRAGYQIEPELTLRTGRFPDGREIVFPVQRLNISSHGQ